MTIHHFPQAATAPAARPNNPFEVSKAKLIAGLAALKAPNPLRSFPDRQDFEAVGKYILDAAKLFDELLADIGHQVKHTASCNVDMSQFTGAFVGAVDGNATHECDVAAENAEGDTQGREASWPQGRV